MAIALLGGWASLFVTHAYGADGQTPSGLAAKVPAALLGRWRLVADDDKPGEKPPEEVIEFRADATWRVTGNGEPFSGHFRVDHEELVMMMVIDGNTRVRRRGFKLDAQGLHFDNDGRGYAHYEKAR